MNQTRADVAQHLVERWCWQAARRDDSRVARRLYRRPVVDGVSRLDEGALLDDFFSFLQQLGVVDGLSEVRSTRVQREMVPVVQDCLAVEPEDAVRGGSYECRAASAGQG